MPYIMVSISCITYNHEKYIAKAIEGFLMQKTDFKFEILIHDDASTDRTADIIRSYERQYPELIKPIYQTENQYSKGRKRIGFINNKRARGKYIAVCEGDDYWTDPYKLHKQITYMESHHNCTMCFHNAERVYENELATGMFMIDKNIDSRGYSSGELAVIGFIPTASTVFLKSVLDNPPEWYFRSVVGDYPTQLITTYHGYAYYISDVMSAYRTGVPGSATERFTRKSLEERIDYINGFVDILNNFDEYSNYKYTYEVEKAKIIKKFQMSLLRGNINELKDPKYKAYYDALGAKVKLKLHIIYYFPQLANVKALLRKLSRKIKSN